MSTTEKDVTKEMPYTVVRHSSLPKPRLSIVLTGEGIKKLASLMNNEDRVRITEWSDITDECSSERYFQKITIIKKV